MRREWEAALRDASLADAASRVLKLDASPTRPTRWHESMASRANPVSIDDDRSGRGDLSQERGGGPGTGIRTKGTGVAVSGIGRRISGRREQPTAELRGDLTEFNKTAPRTDLLGGLCVSTAGQLRLRRDATQFAAAVTVGWARPGAAMKFTIPLASSAFQMRISPSQLPVTTRFDAGWKATP